MLILLQVVLVLILPISLVNSASPYQKNMSEMYEQFPMYQDTTKFYNLLFPPKHNDENQEDVTEVATKKSATTLSPNDVNFPRDTSSDKEEAKYIKISSSIEIPETESVKIVLDALKVLWDASITSMWKGFMPSMERVRRDTSAYESTKGIESYNLFCFASYVRVLFPQDSFLTG